MMADRLAEWMASDLSGLGGAPMRTPLFVFQAIQKIGTISTIRGSSGNFGFNNLLEG